MTKSDVLSRCVKWQRGLPNPLFENSRVSVGHLAPEELADGGGIGWVVRFTHKGEDGSIQTIAEQPLCLVATGHEDDRRLETYLRAVSRALVQLMSGAGTLWFHCENALDSTAATEDEFVDQILLLNEPMW